MSACGGRASSLYAIPKRSGRLGTYGRRAAIRSSTVKCVGIFHDLSCPRCNIRICMEVGGLAGACLDGVDGSLGMSGADDVEDPESFLLSCFSSIIFFWSFIVVASV